MKKTASSVPSKTSSKSGFAPIRSLFSKYELKDKGGFITQEFQDYGYRLAIEFNDLRHKSLYIKMAKEQPRSILEQARSFVLDANAKSKARLFMWKVRQLSYNKQDE